MAWFWKRPVRPATHNPRADRHGDPLPVGATVRLGTGRLQHVADQGNEGLGALAYSPDGALLAGAGRDGRVSLWEASTGRLVRDLARHGSEINCLAFSPDGRLLVTGGRDGQAILWDTVAGTCVYQVEADGVDVSAVAFSPHGDAWVAAGFAGPARLFHARRPDILCEFATKEDDEERQERIVAVAFSPDATRLATASAYTFQAEEIPPEKVDDFNLLSDLPGLGCGDVMGYIMSDPEGFAEKMQEKAQNMMKAMKEEFGDAPGGHGFTFGEEGGVARGWRVGEAGRLTIWRLPAGIPEVSWDLEEGAPYLLAFSADGAVLASVGRGVQAWDLASRRRLAPGRFPPLWQAGPGFSPQGRTILVSPDGRSPAQLWDAVVGREIIAFDPARSWGPFAFSPKGDSLAVALPGGTVEICDPATGRELLPLPRHPAWIAGLALAAAAPVVAVVSTDVHLWDRATGTELSRLDRYCRLPALSPDGTRLAGVVTTSMGEANLVVWDCVSGRSLVELEGVEPTALHFADDATLMVGNAMGQVGRYDLVARRWQKILRGPEDAVDSVAVSACGRFVAAGSVDNVVRLWRIASGEVLSEIPVPAPEVESSERRPARLAVSREGARFAWASSVGQVLLWDSATGKRLGKLSLDAVENWAVGFDDRGRCLAAEATASGDDVHEFRVRVWDVQTGKQVFATEIQPYPITELEFTADRRLLASAGADRTVVFWEVNGG